MSTHVSPATGGLLICCTVSALYSGCTESIGVSLCAHTRLSQLILGFSANSLALPLLPPPFHLALTFPVPSLCTITARDVPPHSATPLTDSASQPPLLQLASLPSHPSHPDIRFSVLPVLPLSVSRASVITRVRSVIGSVSLPSPSKRERAFPRPTVCLHPKRLPGCAHGHPNENVEFMDSNPL